MATHHTAEDGLELYTLDRLAEPSAAPVGEYLLVREECLARLADPEKCIKDPLVSEQKQE